MVGRFWKNRGGNISLMLALTAMPMIVAIGSGLDLMQYERTRASLQSGLDRGVLAAASLNQSKPRRETIQGYLSAFPESAYTLTDDGQDTYSFKTVSATATYAMPTTFLQLLGIDEMKVVAKSKAQEQRRHIEVSLVLDLSGSMRLNGRLAAMRPAAKSFVHQILSEDQRATTSVNLIPYAGQVSVGKAAFDALTAGTDVRTHDKSSCFGNLDKSFSPDIPDFTTAEHVPQFSTWKLGTNDGFDPWNCPTEETSVTFLSNDPDYLSTQIDGFHMFDGTATHIAMKWALNTLDPDFSDSLELMRDNGGPTVDPVFSDRPAPFDDSETRKVIVLMTDGEIVAQQRPISGKPVNPQPTKGGTNKQVMNQSDAIRMMTAACDAARDRRIAVYAIGFEVESSSPVFREKLKACATTPSYYYDATTLNIATTFKNIAGSIEQVHLVQFQ